MYGVASDGGGALSAAKRRRERRLRCHWKHECLSVRMAVAAARHHSSGSEGVEGVTYVAPRRPKPPLPGKRPGLPPEPAPQVRAATVGYVAAAGPLLVPPVLGGGDTLDDATVSFLLAQSLLERQELQEMVAAAKRREEVRLEREEAVREVLLQKERKMARIDRLVDAGRPVPADDLAEWQAWHAPGHTAPSLSSSGKRKKRKKRRRTGGRGQVYVGEVFLHGGFIGVDRRFDQAVNDDGSRRFFFCADNHNYFHFKLKGQGRSLKWEVRLRDG